jgi:hypothetical protein
MAFLVEKEKRHDRNYSANMNLHPFLFMGCWNKPSEGHAAVMESLLAQPERILVLAGDNAYSDKKTNIMNHNFVFGEFDKLKVKEKFVALGNHNLDDTKTKEHEFNLHNQPDQHWNMPDNYYSYTFTDNHAIIVIDSSPFHFWPEKKYRNTNLDFVNEMMTWLRRTVANFKETKIQYYLVQHDPIVAHKHDGVRYLPEGQQIMDAIVDYPPKSILCADIHNFQEGLLEYKGKLIKQYVTGTGGGDPYRINSIVFNSPSKGTERLRYMLERYTSGFGFLKVSNDWKNPAEFVKVQEWPGYTQPNQRQRHLIHELDPRRNNFKKITRKNRTRSRNATGLFQ